MACIFTLGDFDFKLGHNPISGSFAASAAEDRFDSLRRADEQEIDSAQTGRLRFKLCFKFDAMCPANGCHTMLIFGPPEFLNSLSHFSSHSVHEKGEKCFSGFSREGEKRNEKCIWLSEFQ